MKHNLSTLKELYEHRKAATKAPASLKASLLKNAPTKRKPRLWRTAMPAAFASLLVVIIVWPNREEMLEQAQPSSSFAEFDVMLEVADTPELADNAELQDLYSEEKIFEAETTVASPPAVAAKEATAPIQKMSPAPEALISRSLANDDEVAEGGLFEEVTERVDKVVADAAQASSSEDALKRSPEPTAGTDFGLAKASSDSDVSQLVVVVEGDEGRYKNCEGELIERPITTDLAEGVWVVLETAADGTWSIAVAKEQTCAEKSD